MKNLIYQLPTSENISTVIHRITPIFLSLLVWFTLSKLLNILQPNAALIDFGLWQLLVLSALSFVGAISLSWWLLNWYWQTNKLINQTHLVFIFNTLTPWQQVRLYWASFALLLITAVACLIAIF